MAAPGQHTPTSIAKQCTHNNPHFQLHAFQSCDHTPATRPQAAPAGPGGRMALSALRPSPARALAYLQTCRDCDCRPPCRRHLWDLVDRVKRGRAVVLTTHSMEEADILGDRWAEVW